MKKLIHLRKDKKRKTHIIVVSNQKEELKNIQMSKDE